MTYEMRTQTIALDEHEMRSIRRWLNEMESVNGKDIFLQRAPDDFQRPAFILEEIDRRTEDRGRSFTAEKTDWQIEVMTEGFWDAKRLVAEIRQRALQSCRIPLYLWGWRFPGVSVVELPGQGSLPAGEVSVGITAVNYEDEESLICTPEVITVAAGSAIQVSWIPWPRGVPVAKEYRVYAGALDAEKLEATVADSGKRISAFHTISSLAGTGAAPPTTSVFFANRYIRVDDEVRSHVDEHPQVDGVFNGFINFSAQVESVRIARPGEAPKHEIETVTKDVEVV